MKDNCRFCNIDFSKVFNTVLEETNNFLVIPTLGSLVDGYVLIITKEHLYNMNQLDEQLKVEYFNLVDKYRKLFMKIYGKYPIVFEHGTSMNLVNESASSVVHAHTHIVNHNYLDENKIIKELNFKSVQDMNNVLNDERSYVYYISPNGFRYITYDFDPISQLMRIYIAKDLGIDNLYNWKKDLMEDNIIKTINKIKKEFVEY